MRKNWYTIADVDDVPSPALLVYPDRVEDNIRRMIAIAGGVERLRPHIKTHKLAEVVRMQMALDITKFKCATIAEAEMAAGCGAPDVLLAYQPVGPNVERFIQLVKKFPETKFSTIADDASAIRALSEAAKTAGLGSARGSRAPLGGPPSGTNNQEAPKITDGSSVRGPSPARQSSEPTEGAHYSKRNLPHFEKPWAIYAIHFATRQLRRLSPTARQVVLDCILRWNEQRYRLITACVMPDHVHLIIQPGIESMDSSGNSIFYSLEKILQTIKSYTAHEINKLESASGALWEKESFDRYVRSDRDLEQKFHYICINPWDSGLVQPNEPYPWLWTPEGFAASRREEHAGGVCSPELEVLLDIDCGQHRTGVAPGPKAIELYRLIASLPGLKPGGLHVYDGHIHDADLATRTKTCKASFAPVDALRQELTQAGLPVPRIVAGGTPTFPIHARRSDVECSPGTCLFWDAGYAKKLPDLDFLPAALVLTRVVSKPGKNLLCLDLGHKAIASENPHPRVQFLNLPDAKALSHSEEHLVVETTKAKGFAVGDCFYGIPWHICPTVALHGEAVVVENGQAGARWKIVARERRLTI
jgi:D-serine deaminase-like pyridoxal phosphate-dependent protein/REP element-mobilizing transposase RayT